MLTHSSIITESHHSASLQPLLQDHPRFLASCFTGFSHHEIQDTKHFIPILILPISIIFIQYDYYTAI